MFIWCTYIDKKHKYMVTMVTFSVFSFIESGFARNVLIFGVSTCSLKKLKILTIVL